MELLHRLAIVLVAALLVFSIAFAAGQIAGDDHGGASPRPTASPAANAGTSPRDDHVTRLGRGAQTGGVEAPPLVAEPTPSAQP
jgi:hypothetical protein